MAQYFRHNPTAAFRLLPYITRDHWFMRSGWMEEDNEDGTDSELEDEELFESKEADMEWTAPRKTGIRKVRASK